MGAGEKAEVEERADTGRGEEGHTIDEVYGTIQQIKVMDSKHYE